MGDDGDIEHAGQFAQRAKGFVGQRLFVPKVIHLFERAAQPHRLLERKDPLLAYPVPEQERREVDAAVHVEVRARIGHARQAVLALQDLAHGGRVAIHQATEDEARREAVGDGRVQHQVDHVDAALPRRIRQRPVSLDDDTEAGERLGSELADAAPRLDKVMEQKEMSSCVQSYLAELPDSYRAAILLHDAEGLTNPEIAAMLGVSLPTVKIRLHRARARLRDKLSGACSFSTDERGVYVCDPKADDTGD